MTMHRATAEGDIPLTPDEEAEVLAERAEYDSLANKKRRLKARLHKKRLEVEHGGAIVAGAAVATDAESQMRIFNALSFTARNPARVLKRRNNDGTFSNVNASQMVALADAVGEFVAKCGDNEAAHVAAIDALPTTGAVDSYDITTGWPS